MKAIDKETLTSYVVKIIEIKTLEKSHLLMLIKELKILQFVDHPNIVEYVDSYCVDGQFLYVSVNSCILLICCR